MMAIARAPFFATRRPPARLGHYGLGLSASLAMLLSACAPTPPVAAPPPAPRPRPAPRPAPAPSPTPTDWRDLPITPGAWRWSLSGGVSQTAYETPGAAPQIIMACQGGQVRLIIPGAVGGVIQITTATQTRQASAQSDAAGAVLPLPAADRLLDAIAFTRGRWQVEVTGHAPLLLPADASASRVIEDCRAPR
ncbi:hypothetical protein [Novosphingobium humi]|uniref:Uncharacterized protein n=1 Tax=Novosphingobium humi TaxID=2282397 RepID=A0ABY7TSG2_9SPHN|nr:hypothetical protein [Novosphingobium humi]WCT76141.1 hypothetical protein PQ457_09270 [Novosphingobium humi]